MNSSFVCQNCFSQQQPRAGYVGYPPNQSYNPSNQSYNPSNQSSNPSNQSFSQPSQSYNPSSQSYNPPSQSYNPPSQSYNPPSQSYNPPSQSYNPPSQSYNPPSQSYNPPSQSYNSSSHLYNPPSQSYNSSSQLYNPQVANPVHAQPLQRKKSFLARQLGHLNAEEEKKRFFTYIMETTTFTGLPKVYFVPRWYLKVMWLLFFGIAFCYMGLMMMDLFKDYFLYPIKTDTTLAYRALPLPAVTVCNENPIRLSKLPKTTCDLQYRVRLSPFKRSKFCRERFGDEIFPKPAGSGDIMHDIRCKGYDKSCKTYMIRKEVNRSTQDILYSRRRRIKDEILSMDSKKIYKYGHQLNRFIMSCRNRGNKCDMKQFTASLSSKYGICYTWNPKEEDVAIGSGHERGLELTLNLEIEEYIKEYSDGYGVQLIIHDNNTVPLPDNFGMALSSGQETSVAIKFLNVSRLGGKYGTCNDGKEFYNKYKKEYSEEVCRLFCLAKFTHEMCDCYPSVAVEIEHFYKGFQLYCRDHKSICEQMVENNMARNRTMRNLCNCGYPCKRIDYEKRVTARMWPSKHHLEQLEGEICKKKSKDKACISRKRMSLNTRRTSFAKVYVFYESLNYENVVEKPFYTKTKLMSDLGGTMGLMIGVSLLSIAELIEFFLEYSIMMFRKIQQWNYYH